MTFDVCIATYNSARWLRPCVAALAAVLYDTKALHLLFADNASTDDTITVLNTLQEEYEDTFGEFTVLPQGSNLGFGAASNAAARAGKGEYALFLNPDTEVDPGAFSALEASIAEAGEKYAGFEMRQFPYEHPKYYNPATLETSWCSGACFAVRRTALEQVGGFDESIFLYAEDVELSWHLRAEGYKLRYVPNAVVHHYAYATPGEEKPAQVAGSLVGNLVLREKYGSEEDIAWWENHYEKNAEQLHAKPGVQPLLKQAMKRAKRNRRQYRAFYTEKVRDNLQFRSHFYGLDYEFARTGAFYENHLPQSKPFFSVLVRTYKRPELLRMTLRSLCWQTYRAFEVVVVEDGEEPQSAAVVEEFKDKLEIQYIPLKEQAGRCVAGNRAIEAAKAEHLCFLDDDDYFYPEHLEVMACLVEENPDCRLLVAGAVEASCEALNRRGTRWRIVERCNIAYKRITFATLCYGNPFPIQAAVFHKSLVEEAGGLAPEMDAFEDWDLWMRFGRHTPIACTDKATSLYKIPAGEKAFAEREKVLAGYRKLLYKRAKDYTATLSAQDILALVYTPEKAQEYEDAGQNAIDYIAYKDKLAETAGEILSSRVWRLSWPVRCLPRLLAALCGGLSGVFHGLHRKTAEWADSAGPKKPNLEKKDPAELNDFIFKSRRSASWRFGSWLAGLFKNKKEAGQ